MPLFHYPDNDNSRVWRHVGRHPVGAAILRLPHDGWSLCVLYDHGFSSCHPGLDGHSECVTEREVNVSQKDAIAL